MVSVGLHNILQGFLHLHLEFLENQSRETEKHAFQNEMAHSFNLHCFTYAKCQRTKT